MNSSGTLSPSMIPVLVIPIARALMMFSGIDAAGSAGVPMSTTLPWNVMAPMSDSITAGTPEVSMA